MATVGVVLRTLQRQQWESYVTILRMSSSVSCLTRRHGNQDNQVLPKPRRNQPILIARRFASNQSKDESSKEVGESIEEVDIGPGTWKEVYNGILTTQIRMVKVFSLSTSIMGLSVQPILVQKLTDSGLGLVVAMGSFIGFFTFVTPLIIHWITKKYVTKLEYNPSNDTYTATTLSFFLREKKIEFHADEVHVPTLPGLFTTFTAKEKPLFVEPSMFHDVSHYSRLMGYDKPIDFEMPEDKEKKEN
ncbi:transmembrane protein 70 homolog, mitochondrial isoform X2 [Oratosquilla oratoria]